VEQFKEYFMQHENLYQELVDYIYWHQSKFMTADEKTAARTVIHLLKDNDDKMLAAKKKMGWISNDHRVFKMLANGYDEFKHSVASRIYSQHRDELTLNLCPKCGKIAKTPKAKQCRICFYDWHSA